MSPRPYVGPSPAYAILVARRDPGDANYAAEPWSAVATRCDGRLVALQFGASEEKAIARALAHVRDDRERSPVTIALREAKP